MNKIIAFLFLALSTSLSAQIAPVSSGDAISAQKINEVITKVTTIDTRVLSLENLPISSKVSGVGEQQVANSPAMTQVNFGAEVWDFRNNMTPAGSFTAPEAGVYSVKSTVWFTLNNVNGVTYLAVYVNGSSASNGQVYANTMDRMGGHVSDDIYLNANDVVTIWLYQGSNAPRNIGARTFAIHKIR